MASQTRPLSSYHPHMILISSSYHSTRTMILFKNRGQEGIMILASQFIDWWMGFSPFQATSPLFLLLPLPHTIPRQIDVCNGCMTPNFICLQPQLAPHFVSCPFTYQKIQKKKKKKSKNPKRFSGKLAQTFPNKKGNSLEMIKIQKSTLLQ